ncbi:MAG: WD40 repeat domain-containing serine/threonine protein kinase [Isosphaerales bacterium]
MVQRIDDQGINEGAPPDASDDDDRVGEAVEAYLTLAEQGQPPAIDEFVTRFPDLENDVRAALEGLELVHGLLGLDSATGSGPSRGTGVDHRIESGRRIAGYRVVRELGRGGMGTVYEAVHVALDRPVALKVLGTHAAPDSSARRRFMNEARTAAGLHHTHIVPVFDVGQVGGLCYYAMQRIEGSGLDRVLRHLRRTRPAASGGGDSLARSRFPKQDWLAASGASSIHSRLGQLWSRLSSGWQGRQQRPAGWGPGSAGPGTAHSVPPLSRPGTLNGPRAPAGLGDSTASWDTAGRPALRPDQRAGEDAASSAVVPGSLAALTAIEPDPRRRDDEPPPFDPRRGSAYFRWVAEVGVQSADALAHAHHQGVIHRDVKPSNLLIDAKGNIWVTDFGLARRLADPGLTHHDSLLGTPRYMSPEQARTGAIDGRTDVYSLGATLYELLTLRPPFDGQSAAELLDQIGQLDPLPPSAIDPRVPRDLETVVLKALAKRPADRYLTADELAADLTRFLNREPVKARRISPVGRLWRVARRHPGITSVTTVAVATILAIATYAYVRVVVERNHARVALQREKEASSKERAARKEKLLPIVELVGLSGTPNRRSHGLALIEEAAKLELEPELRTKLRDEAVKFLVLREVEAHEPELPTGRAHGLVFGPTGHRLAVLSEDDEELAFWDVERRQRLTTLSLRVGSSPTPSGASEANPGDRSSGERTEPGLSSTAAANPARTAPGPGMTAPGARRNANWLVGQRVAQTGPCVASLLPGDKGLGLIDPQSGAPPRILNRSDRSVMSVLADPAGRRLLTIDLVLPDDMMVRALMEGLPASEVPFHEYAVNLWDPDHLDRPIKTLLWRFGPPLAAISPDGKTVAVAPFHGTSVRLFAGVDGKPLRRSEIESQTELSALALGPNDLLATAGNTAGGVAIRIWDLDRPGPAFPTSLTPSTQTRTRLLRFSTQGTLLAIVGGGPIELWDPAVHSLVAVLQMNDQATDLAFAPDGRTLAAVGRAGGTSVWTVDDSAARTQLSGFDSPHSSLAFRDDGLLAGAGWNGDVWSWRNGRCPEIAAPLPHPAAPPPPTSLSSSDPRRGELPGRDGMRKDGRAFGRDGGRPMGRERPMSPTTTLAFDSLGRLIDHDTQGMHIWAPGFTPAQAPPIQNYSLPRLPGRMMMTQMATTPDGRIMVLVRSSGLFLWRAEAPHEVVPVSPPRSGAETAPVASAGARRGSAPSVDAPFTQFRAVAIAPRGDRIYMIEQSLGQPGLLRAWSIQSPSEAARAQARDLDWVVLGIIRGRWPVVIARAQARDLNWVVPLTNGATSLALRPDGAVLAAGDRTGTVTLIDTARRTVLKRIKPQSAERESFWLAMAFSPDGRDLAVGSPQGKISLWSVASPTEPHLRLHLPGHRGTNSLLVFDSQGRRLASAEFNDPLVEVWDLDLLQREIIRLGLADY